MKLVRWILGKLILFIDAITAPKPMHRDETRQQKINAETAELKLYQYLACPFCVKARRTIRRLGLEIETRDAKREPQWLEELENQGGKVQVPCLKITHADGSTEWMYESNSIIQYLETRFAN